MDHPVPEFPAGQKFFPQFFFSDILQFFSYDSSLTLQLQGCQMVYIFSNQTPQFLVYFGRPLTGTILISFMTNLYTVWPFDVFHGNFVCIHNLLAFGMLSPFWYLESRKIWQPCSTALCWSFFKYEFVTLCTYRG
jgi:hypothetical protein